MMEILTAIQSMKVLVDLFKSAKDALPDDLPKKAEITRQIDAAEKATQLAEAQVAEALGYVLCQCTWPPQIMLRKGYDNVRSQDILVCENCNNRQPPELESSGPALGKSDLDKLSFDILKLIAHRSQNCEGSSALDLAGMLSMSREGIKYSLTELESEEFIVAHYNYMTGVNFYELSHKGRKILIEKGVI